MELFISGCILLLLSGMVAVLLGRSRMASWVAALGVWAGCGMALIPVVTTLTGHPPDPLRIAWSMPGGSLILGLDGLSAFFCLPVLLISPLAALYGCEYLAHEKKSLGSVLFFCNVLIASMLLLMAARNGLLFLVVWEIMAVSSFFLVVFDDEHAPVREAGWTYLIATHIGTGGLLVFFALLGKQAGSLDFEAMAAAKLAPAMATVLFALAVTGFGSKAGFIPMHVWLPEAHPAAPSHVSALMSGVMIKTGIYGLLRALTLLGAPQGSWGWALVIIGLVSGLLGVVLALAQNDIKRLLAYCSVENIGVITLGIGTGILGLAWHQNGLVLLGFGGGILHVLNHAVFKSLLFFGAGSIVHATGTRDMNQLGGLFKSMRWTGLTFLVACAAISGLPPFNGFVSEFLIYVAGFSGVRTGATETVVLAILVTGGLAMIGGLAAACFTKAFGILFLGEPRSDRAIGTHEAGAAMRWPMAVLAVACLGIGLLAPTALRTALPAVRMMADTQTTDPSIQAVPASEPWRWFSLYANEPSSDARSFFDASTAVGSLTAIVSASLGLLILVTGLFLIRRRLPRGREEAATGTWDCGYARPTARMQYTATSFAQPLTHLFRLLLGTRKPSSLPQGFFPKDASFETHTPDAAREWLFAPLFRAIDRGVAPIRRMQHGRVHGYLLYIAIVLILLLIWKAGGRS
jgi:formate hydrogenlyase subunit 3/multisubunit Na+/H+ antiporter MnhD subunit